ncbi:MAG TPA: hypothetical protein PLJ60_12345 [Chryseolinea sp.]|nr:hypothetical protein [Chryseolinea sp.]HPM31114.1 hypothetical protein [Chryseolinea sp.]
MVRRLLLFVIFLFPAILSAQERIFNYYRKGDYVQFSSGNYIIGFDAYKNVGTANSKKERSVTTTNGVYRSVIQKGDGGNVELVLNSKDSVVATVLLSKENRGNIVLPDGRVLEYNVLSKYKGSYTMDGQEVFTYTIEDTSGWKAVIVQCYDQTLPLEALQIISFENSAGVLYTVKNIWIVIGVAVGLAMLRLATGSL